MYNLDRIYSGMCMQKCDLSTGKMDMQNMLSLANVKLALHVSLCHYKFKNNSQQMMIKVWFLSLVVLCMVNWDWKNK